MKVTVVKDNIEIMEYTFDLGNYTRPITTKSNKAQKWFDRGLIWAYGFNWEESHRCFQRALKSDPDCAMAWWGIAYSVGPEYNRQWHQLDNKELSQILKESYEAIQKALSLSKFVSTVEKNLISALSARHPSNKAPQDFNDWTNAYANAMRAVYKKHPNDQDVTALFAEALISRTPWKLWDLRTGKACAGSSTLEASLVLEKSIEAINNKLEPLHVGILHYYLHLMEMSPTPEAALITGDKMRTLVPDSGHLAHMSTHIDFQCGHYSNVVSRNSEAIKADRKFLKCYGALSLFSYQVIHNIHFKLYGAMFLGHYQASMEAVKEFETLIPEALIQIESPPMADMLEGYFALRYHALIRFGRWQDIINEELPKDSALYLVTTAIAHYAKSLANAALGNITAAKEEKLNFDSSVALVPDTRVLFNNTCVDILEVANSMLCGEIEYRIGNFDIAFEHLKEAINLEDNLPYDEPWGWMQPARHALGALLLEQGKVSEAELVYKADLGFDSSLIRARWHPNNVWSLHGLHESLKKQNKEEELALITPNLIIALAGADVSIKASCFCRLKKP